MTGFYHKFLKKLAHFQVENPIKAVLIILFLTIAIYGGVGKVMTVASMEQMMPVHIEEIKAFNTLRDNNLGQDIIAIVIEIDRDAVGQSGVIDIRDKRVVEYTRHLSSMLNEEMDIREVYSISMMVPEEFPEEGYNDLMQAEMFSDFISKDYTKTVVMAITDVGADDVRMNLLSTKIKQDVKSAGLPPGVKIKLTGTPIIQQKLGELIAKDRSSTQWISTFFVFLITLIIFGTFTSALVPIIAVTVSVNWLYGTMGYVGLPISTLAGGVAAMVIGIGIDFAIHIMNKFKYERKKGLGVKESIELAVVETGTALTATSLTTIVAFLAFITGAMPEMGRFGILMAIGISYALIFSLFGLPALLVLEEKIIYRLKKKMRFGIEGELHLEKVRGAKK
ncbi:MAG: MMPL family transporter [Nanoarchaeota archaeon]|jgi:predicted RND superfamily exporter protein|nr:MMPL family transporter [Nanoarchaeota archaeon]